MNKKMELYLGQESLESVEQWIKLQLQNGATIFRVVQSMIGTNRGDIIISKWDGSSVASMTLDEQVQVLAEYIKSTCKNEIRVSGLSDEIIEIMADNYIGVELDTYADYLTELMGIDGFNKVSTHITSIMASFKPYMMQRFPNKYEKLSKEDIEIELVRFIKQHLIECVQDDFVKGETRAN